MLLIAGAASQLSAQAEPSSYIRVNQVGYLPDAVKIAVVCSLEPADVAEFSVLDGAGRQVFGPASASREPGFGPCVTTHRLDFSDVRDEGTYRIVAGDAEPVAVRISARAYAGGVDTLLA